MIDPVRFARMRKLLEEACAAPARTGPQLSSKLFPNAAIEDPICVAIRRRAIVMQIDLATKRYDLKRDVEAYIAAAGQYSLAGLTTPQLDALATFVSDAMDRATHACDHPDEPPAR